MCAHDFRAMGRRVNVELKLRGRAGARDERASAVRREREAANDGARANVGGVQQTSGQQS